MKTSLYLLLHSLWLLACALAGTLVAHTAVVATGLAGTAGAVATVAVAMVLTVLVFIATVAAGRALGRIR